MSPSVATNPTIKDALQLGIKESVSSAEHKKVMAVTAGKAAAYFAANGIKLVKQVDERAVAKYIKSMQSRGLKPASIRHYLVPIRHAIAVTKWDTGHGIDFKSLPIPKREYGPANFVPAPEMLEVLDTIRAFGRWRSYACLAACFMAGLRLSEFNRLTRDKLRGDVLEISGRTKNLPSRRVIPIPSTLVDILEQWFAMDMEPISCVRNLGRQVRNSLDMAFESLCLDLDVEAREGGRKSFMQWASALNLDENAVRAYAGHTLRDMRYDDALHNNYQYNAPPRPEQTEAQRSGPMLKLREMVSDRIEEAIRGSRFRP